MWWTMIKAQTVGSWLSRSQNGYCVSDYTFNIDETNVALEPNFWYYLVCILFDATCMIIICFSLKKLARRSTGFSKLISQCVQPTHVRTTVAR